MRLTSLLGLSLTACGASHEAPDANVDDCAIVTMDVQGNPIDTFVVGLDKVGAAGAVDFKLMSVTPAPPARGDNTWIVQLSSMAAGVVGSPLAGATMTATPFMLSHGHGTPINVQITPMATAGQYQLAPVNMWMPGVWQTTIQVSTPASDTAVYRFCIPN